MDCKKYLPFTIDSNGNIDVWIHSYTFEFYNNNNNMIILLLLYFDVFFWCFKISNIIDVVKSIKDESVNKYSILLALHSVLMDCLVIILIICFFFFYENIIFVCLLVFILMTF